MCVTDGKTAWLLYSENYSHSMNGKKIGTNPPGGHNRMVFHQFELYRGDDVNP